MAVALSCFLVRKTLLPEGAIKPRRYMNCNLPTFHITPFTAKKAITAEAVGSAHREWILSVGLLKKSNSLFPIKTNANSPTATPSEHDFVGGKKSTAIPIQAKPLMKKRRKSDQGGGFCKRTRKTFLIHHQKFSRGAEGPSVCVLASRSSNFEWQATETWVLAAVLHIYGDSASSFVSLKARILCVSV